MPSASSSNKSGADRATGGVATYLLNGRILAGLVCYTAVMVLFVAAFKRGGSLSVLYPVNASTFIWGDFIAMLAYGTAIRPVHVLGMTPAGRRDASGGHSRPSSSEQHRAATKMRGRSQRKFRRIACQ